MKKLLLIRHAQATHLNEGNDFSRDLSLKGETDCEKMSAHLKEQSFIPDLVKLSSSNRTRQTTQIFASALNWPSEILLDIKSLYMADNASLLAEISNTPNSTNSLVVVGHNPGISELCTDLKNNIFCDLPNCALVLFEFNTNTWSDISGTLGKVLWQSSPNSKN